MNKTQRLLDDIQKLLDDMIALYVRDGKPIGSESLRLTLGSEISSSTIRNYFKVLVSDGILLQPHISSGRIPANHTLKAYWRKNIDIDNILFIGDSIGDFRLSRIENISKKYEIFCNIRLIEREILKEVINYDERFIIVVFDTLETILPYSKHLYHFLNELIGQELEDIKSVAKSVCATSLFYKLERTLRARSFNFGYEFLSDIGNGDLMMEILNAHIYYTLKNGFYFDLCPEGYLGLIQDICIGKDYGKMFLFGKLRCDYRGFYDEIAS